MSLFYTIEEELGFPFTAKLAGDTVSIVGIKQSEYDPLGLSYAGASSEESNALET